MSTVSPIPTGDVWVVKRRLEAWAGEVRVNLIRVAAILAFYGHHLFNFHVSRDPTIDVDYHAIVTLLVVAWSILAGLLFFLLRRRQVPPGLKYASRLGTWFFSHCSSSPAVGSRVHWSPSISPSSRPRLCACRCLWSMWPRSAR